MHSEAHIPTGIISVSLRLTASGIQSEDSHAGFGGVNWRSPSPSCKLLQSAASREPEWNKFKLNCAATRLTSVYIRPGGPPGRVSEPPSRCSESRILTFTAASSIAPSTFFLGIFCRSCSSFVERLILLAVSPGPPVNRQQARLPRASGVHDCGAPL